MDRNETIRELCKIVFMAYASIGDYTHACDCFCDKCNLLTDHYRNEGKVIEYVRQAVREKLERDGVKIVEVE